MQRDRIAALFGKVEQSTKNRDDLRDKIKMLSQKLHAQHDFNEKLATDNARMVEQVRSCVNIFPQGAEDLFRFAATPTSSIPDQAGPRSQERMDTIPSNSSSSITGGVCPFVDLGSTCVKANGEAGLTSRAEGHTAPEAATPKVAATKGEPLPVGLVTMLDDQVCPSLDASSGLSNQEQDAPAQEGKGRPCRYIPRNTTTLVVRNIPARYNQQKLLKEWDPKESGINIMHLPFSIRMRRNVGYVFLNFVTYEQARFFQELWHGAVLADHGTCKRLDVAHAPVQGFQRNLESLHARGVDRMANPSRHPMVFDENGNEIDFGEALAMIKKNA